MEIFTSSAGIQKHLLSLKSDGKSIGFVPTMGALHQGHISLLEKAKTEVDVVICSIFVNPLQFNRKEDLDNYPNRLEADKKLLQEANCDIIFHPSKEDLFKFQPKIDYQFGSIGKGMEAEYRPGHFEGVAAVIQCFFEVLSPTKAYFGEKDYQQLAIVRWLTQRMNIDTQIVECKTFRFDNGLAMSSRNYLLSEKDMSTASVIYQVLLYCKVNRDFLSPKTLADKCFLMLKKDFDPEYFIIADELSMKQINKWSDSKQPRAFVAAYLSSVRLIDNLSLNP